MRWPQCIAAMPPAVPAQAVEDAELAPEEVAGDAELQRSLLAVRPRLLPRKPTKRRGRVPVRKTISYTAGWALFKVREQFTPLADVLHIGSPVLCPSPAGSVLM